MKNKSTTPSQFKEFIKECDFWMEYFGMYGWDTVYTNDIPEENDSYASSSPDNIGRIVVINLNKECGDLKPTLQRVRMYAFHEVSEIRYSQLSIMVIDKVINFLDMRVKQNVNFIKNIQVDISEYTHNLIRIDENRIWKPMYYKRFKNKIKLND